MNFLVVRPQINKKKLFYFIYKIYSVYLLSFTIYKHLLLFHFLKTLKTKNNCCNIWCTKTNREFILL